MWIGLDIGGANLKASDGLQLSRSVPFAVWKQSGQLAGELGRLLSNWPQATGLAVTMTAELADCFATKAEGVAQVLAAVSAASGGKEVAVWQTGGEFFSLEEAAEFPRLVAAANWHALATWAGRMTSRDSGLLIDIGSTTTDVIPIVDGVPAAEGWTDSERLATGELVYAGVRRTPLCALAASVRWRGRDCGLAAEWFATTLDLFLLSGDIPEAEHVCETADGRPATRSAAQARIARMVCGDQAEISPPEIDDIAAQLRESLQQRISHAVTTVLGRRPSPCRTVLLSGEGEFLAQRLWRETRPAPCSQLLSLNQLLGPEHSAAACAYALARLAGERL